MGVSPDTILIGDCIEQLKTLPDRSVDLVFADGPPLALMRDREFVGVFD